MKELQYDLTTEEQAKRLVELGVPADSANFYYFEGGSGIPNYIHEGVFSSWKRIYDMIGDSVIIPCWSVGRLMDIWDICGNGAQCVTAKIGLSRIELLIKLYEENIEYMDFSKLEE